MKKTLFFAALCLAGMMMISCQPKNEPQTPDQPEQPKDTTQVVTPVAALLDYQIEVTDAMLEVANFNISFYDKNGQLQTEQMTGNIWDTIIVAALPAKLGVRVTTTPKENIDSTKYEVFRVLKKYTYIAYPVDQKGKQIGTDKEYTHNSGVDIPGGQIESYFRKDHFHQVLYKFDEKGEKTYLSEWE